MKQSLTRCLGLAMLLASAALAAPAYAEPSEPTPVTCSADADSYKPFNVDSLSAFTASTALPALAVESRPRLTTLELVPAQLESETLATRTAGTASKRGHGSDAATARYDKGRCST